MPSIRSVCTAWRTSGSDRMELAHAFAWISAERALEGRPVARPAMCRKHVLDRQLKQRT